MQEYGEKIQRLRVVKSVMHYCLLFVWLCSGAVQAQSTAVAGSPDDIRYAKKLWQKMVAQRLVGGQAKDQLVFYGGAKPHGEYLELAYQLLEIDGHSGFVIVKKNYDGADLSVEKVTADRGAYLKALTVMYRRETGYDSDNQDWFWVKYKPDGTLFKKPQSDGGAVALAGRLFKAKTWDESRGCIWCHAAAGGGNYVFYRSIPVPDYKGGSK